MSFLPTRRHVLKVAAQAAAAGCVLRLPISAVAKNASSLLYGVQLYTVRKEAAADLAGTLRTLRQIGYTEIELFPIVYTQPAATLRSIIEDAGMHVPSGHFPAAQVEAKADYARALGMKYMVAMLPRPLPETLDDYRRIGAEFSRLGGIVREHGMEFCMLCHNHEFLPQAGSTGFAAMMSSSDPALLKLEVDIYWLVQAGIDPAAFLHQYRDRVRLLHLKDRLAGAAISFNADASAEHFTELGKGSIPWPALLAQARGQGIRYAFMDQDVMTKPTFDSLSESFAYLKRLSAP